MSHEVSRNTEIHGLLKPHGLLPLGLMQVSDKDQVPDIAESQPARQLLLVGNGGSSLWPVFSHSAEFLDGLANPLDRWSRRVGEKMATDLDARAIFPFDGPPYPPFLSWAGKTGRVSPSPVSMFLHAKFGLWHAYRFALAFSGQQGSLPAEPLFKSACTDCKDQACLKTCPVDAFTDKAYRVDQCMDYLLTNNKATCRSLGCEARKACPVGREFTYLPAHAKFHMDAFVDSNNAIVVCQ